LSGLACESFETIGVGIGIELLKTDSDTDSDPDSENLLGISCDRANKKLL
jgi:hypothetical protein